MADGDGALPGPQQLAVTPIGVVRSPFRELAEAPRQASVASEVRGAIELYPGRGFEHALEGLSAWSHLWVVFWFHLAAGHAPNKVRPPRSTRKRGVFATRSPHRPNPIGLSCVRLVGVEGLRVEVQGLDLVDGTPVLDLKPYVPYADVVVGASSGWLGAPGDPGPTYQIELSEAAQRQLAWLAARGAGDVAERLQAALALGPEPNAYRRIRVEPDGTRTLAIKAFRARFSVDGATIVVLAVASGFRPRDLALGEGEELALHRAFVAAFTGEGG